MSPEEEVQVTMTRWEATRIHAALSALCQVQRKAADMGMGSAFNLTDAVGDIEAVLPRLAEQFPADAYTQTVEVTKMASDTKTYSGPTTAPLDFDIKVSDLKNISPDEAAALFATEYDAAIKAILATLGSFTDYSDQDFIRLLDELKALMESVIPVPKGLTVSQSGPYLEVSDLLTLGGLAFETYKRQAQIDERTSKPF